MSRAAVSLLVIAAMGVLLLAFFLGIGFGVGESKPAPIAADCQHREFVQVTRANGQRFVQCANNNCNVTVDEFIMWDALTFRESR